MIVRCLLIENMDIKHDDEHKLVIVENYILHFSPTEYKLMRLLLIHHLVTETALLKALSFQDTGEAASKLLAKYINRVRNKLNAHGLQVSRVYGYGYILLPLQLPDPASDGIPSHL